MKTACFRFSAFLFLLFGSTLPANADELGHSFPSAPHAIEQEVSTHTEIRRALRTVFPPPLNPEDRAASQRVHDKVAEVTALLWDTRMSTDEIAGFMADMIRARKSPAEMVSQAEILAKAVGPRRPKPVFASLADPGAAEKSGSMPRGYPFVLATLSETYPEPRDNVTAEKFTLCRQKVEELLERINRIRPASTEELTQLLAAKVKTRAGPAELEAILQQWEKQH